MIIFYNNRQQIANVYQNIYQTHKQSMFQQQKIKQNNIDFFQNTFRSSQKKYEAEEIIFQNGHNISFGGNDHTEFEIAQFLNRIHQKINLSNHDSQSQIIQQISFDWNEETQINKKFNIFDGGNQKNCYTCQRNQELRVPDELVILSEVKKLQDFLKLLEFINPEITQQIEKITQENRRIKQENGLLKYKQSKTNIKIQLYENQIKVAEKKNIKLLNDIQYFTKQIQQLKKNYSNLKTVQQYEGRNAEIETYCHQNCSNILQKQLSQIYSQNKNPITQTEVQLSPLINIQLPKSMNLIQKNTKQFQTCKQKFLNTKINPRHEKKFCTKISISTKNSLTTKKLSTINHNDYNYIVSSIFRPNSLQKIQKEKIIKQNVIKYEESQL